MKIIFISSSLEPERDGVGDYTRLLAQECVRLGQECHIIALHDRHTPSILHTDEGNGVTGLRLPSTLSWGERTVAARRALARFIPDWVSLQFVPYGFHDKGLAWTAGRVIPALLAGYKTHVMLHELWIGEAQGASFKHCLYGAGQKHIMLQMLHKLKPQVLHTSNCTYVSILRHYGLQAERLPLFGNIPVGSNTADDWLFSQLREKGADITPANRDRFWLLGFFGSMPSEWTPEPLFGMVREAAQEQDRQVVILSAGGMGAAGKTLWGKMVHRYAPEWVFHALGNLSASLISEYLNTLDFGLATTPISLIGKSGAVATMRDHGLPIIVSRDDELYTHGNNSSGAETARDTELIYRINTNLPEKLARPSPRVTTQQLSETASTMIYQQLSQMP